MKDEFKETQASKFLKERGISAKTKINFTYYELKEFLEDYQVAKWIARKKETSLFIDDSANHQRWYNSDGKR